MAWHHLADGLELILDLFDAAGSASSWRDTRRNGTPREKFLLKVLMVVVGVPLLIMLVSGIWWNVSGAREEAAKSHYAKPVGEPLPFPGANAAIPQPLMQK